MKIIKSRRCTQGCTSRRALDAVCEHERALDTAHEHDIITYSLTITMFHHQNHELRL
jgi:hypothetical protein